MLTLEKLFNWMLVIGFALMIGRLLTFLFLLLDIPFTTFFKDYNGISFAILIIGLIGTHVMKDHRK
ncbi:hypothetical protein [Thalassobacillus pellis]|uniref:hypothetical protein n=1 Tax=Thalassobacillus pellis TaxID=748008 RepID=UPI001960D6C9|nr:hypothetical protein [Thalassobacillus pellis]MBM7553777.1 hypothetical protein [Thalassobacillus pellis]